MILCQKVVQSPYDALSYFEYLLLITENKVKVTLLAISTCRRVIFLYIMQHFTEEPLIEQTLENTTGKANFPTVVDSWRQLQHLSS